MRKRFSFCAVSIGRQSTTWWRISIVLGEQNGTRIFDAVSEQWLDCEDGGKVEYKT